MDYCKPVGKVYLYFIRHHLILYEILLGNSYLLHEIDASWKKIQNFEESFLNFVLLYGVVMRCKFQLIWTKIEGSDTFGVKYLKSISQISILSVFYKRSYQSSKLQNAITFEWKLGLRFHKKPLLPLIEFFHRLKFYCFLKRLVSLQHISSSR